MNFRYQKNKGERY